MENKVFNYLVFSFFSFFMSLINFFNGSFFFYNIEFYFTFVFILFMFFFLGKKVTANGWLLYNVLGKKSIFNNYLYIFINLILFCCLNTSFLLYCLMDKRYFFYDLNYFSNNFIIIFKLIILLILSFTLILCLNYFDNNKILKTYEFFILVWLSILGIFLMISCCDFISFYLCIELQSIIFYVLAGYKQNSSFSIEAGLKYFILGTFSSGLLLFGISIIYFLTGLNNFYELNFLFQQAPYLYNNTLLCFGIFLL